MITLHVEPTTVPVSWDTFCASAPPFSIALDGYVRGGPRFAGLVVTALGGIPLPPIKVHEKGSDKPLPQHASIDLGFGVSLTATMKDGETNEQITERMASRALVFAEKVKR